MKKKLRKLVSLCLAAALVFTAVKLSNITVNAADAVSSVTKIWEGSETAEWSKRIPLEIDWGKANAGDVLLLSAVTEGNSEAYSSFHLINPSWENIISDLSFGYTEGATKTATIVLTNALITACKDGAGVQGFGFTLKKAELVSSKAVKNKTTFNDTAAWGKRIDLGINWNNVSAGDMLILTAVTEGNDENYSSLKLINSSWQAVVDNLSFGYKDGATRYCTIVLTSNIINSAKENGGLGAQGIGFTLKQVSVYSKTLAATATSTPVPTATSTPVPTATSTPVPTATSTPVPTATSTPVPTATSTPVPTATSTPVPTATSTPVPTEEVTPAPVEETTPAPVEEVTPAPVEETTPAPVEETTPAPVEETTPAPVEETTPAPVEEVTPAPVEEATPTPEVENIEDNKTPLDAPDATNGAKNDTDVPKTGDAGSLFEVLLFIGVCGLTVTKLVKKH